MNMHVAVQQDQQLAKPAGAVKFPVQTVSIEHISL